MAVGPIGPTPKDLVRRCVADARAFRRGVNKRPELAAHAMVLARHIKAAAVRLRTYW